VLLREYRVVRNKRERERERERENLVREIESDPRVSTTREPWRWTTNRFVVRRFLRRD